LKNSETETHLETYPLTCTAEENKNIKCIQLLRKLKST